MIGASFDSTKMCLAHFSPDECRNYFRHCGDSAATRS